MLIKKYLLAEHCAIFSALSSYLQFLPLCRSKLATRVYESVSQGLSAPVSIELYLPLTQRKGKGTKVTKVKLSPSSIEYSL